MSVSAVYPVPDSMTENADMVTRHELWDVEAGNMIGAYASQAEALAQVRDLLDLKGTLYAADLAPGRRGDGESEPVIGGADLAQLAMTASGHQTRRAA